MNLPALIRTFAPPPDTGPTPGGSPSYQPSIPLPEVVNQSLKATAALTFTELTAEGVASANDAALYPFAQISERGDLPNICPLCSHVNGMILSVTSPEYAKWRQPSHINCHRTVAFISKEEIGTEVSFYEPDAALVAKHGHYHIDPDKYAELRVPSEPGGRQFIARSVKNAETGETATVLDWAPWFDQVPEWKKALIRTARASIEDGPLHDALALLGITNPLDADQFRLVVLYGLRDRLAGWVTEAVAAVTGS